MVHILKLNEMAFVRDVEELQSALRTSICEFVYTKKDGSRRTAFGTTNKSIISSVGGNLPVGYQDDATIARREGLKNAGYISYYDLEKKHWRNCRVNGPDDVDLISSYADIKEFISAHPAFNI